MRIFRIVVMWLNIVAAADGAMRGEIFFPLFNLFVAYLLYNIVYNFPDTTNDKKDT